MAADRLDPGSVAVAAGVAQRQDDGSVVFDHAVRAHLLSGTTVTLGTPDAAEAFGSSAVSGPVTPAPATQRIAESNPDSDANHPVEVRSTPASDTAARTGTSSHAASGGPAELDELAKQLYGRIRTQFVAELRLDRERAGIAVGLTR